MKKKMTFEILKYLGDSYVSNIKHKRTPHVVKVLLLLFLNMYLSFR